MKALVPARVYHDHILNVVRLSTRRDMSNKRIHEELGKMIYVPNANGLNVFFSRVKEWRATSVAINPASAINEAMLMEYCDSAFEKSGHDPHLLANIDQLWAEEADQEWEDYQRFYGKKLAKLYNDGDKGDKGKESAHYAALEERLAIAESNLEQVNEDQ